MTRFAIVGGLVLLVFLVLGGLAFFAYVFQHALGTRAAPEEAIGSSRTVVFNFMESLRASEFEAAYQLTSAGFRSRQSQEQFASWVGGYPALTQAPESSITPKASGTASKVQYDIRLSGKGLPALRCTVTAVKESDDWKVDALTVP